MRFLLICLGGAAGTAARYSVSLASRALLGESYPYGTLLVNVVGSFLLAVIMYAGLRAEVISPTTRLVLGTGVMGGFTTYSSFNWETLHFVQERSYKLAFVNLFATVIGCLIAGSLGVLLARKMWGDA